MTRADLRTRPPDTDPGTPRLVWLALIAAVVAVASMISHAVSGPSRHTSTPMEVRPSARGDAVAQTHGAEEDSARAERTAAAFLTGYLAYVYGRAPASAITDASPSLLASLEADRPPAPRAATGRYARTVRLAVAPSQDGASARATVNDGGLIDYQLTLTLGARDGRLLVVSVGAAS